MKIELHDKKHYSFQCLDMGKPVQNDLSYCEWFLAPKQEFAKESKTKLKNHLDKLKTAK